MKNLSIAFICFYFFAVRAYSQDTLVRTNNEIILAKVLEINTSTVKYLKFNFQDGPVYEIEKSGLLFIKYAKGYKDSFVNESVKEPRQLHVQNNNDIYDQPINILGNNKYMVGSRVIQSHTLNRIMLAKNDPHITFLVKAAQRSKRTAVLLSFSAIPLGIGIIGNYMGWEVSFSNGGDADFQTATLVCLVATATVCITFPIFYGITRNRKLRAVELYNATYFGRQADN